MPFILMRNDITKVHADAIVNAANTSLLGGGGVDGAIHKAAGEKLLEECKKLGGCEVGQAKLTKGYKMPCKYIIHTVGPIWRSGGKEEETLLYSCYKNSLELAVSKKCKSVAFPLISAGAYGCPKEKALSIAKKAISDFLETHEIEVMLVLFDRASVNIGGKLFSEIQSYIDDRYSEEQYPSEYEKQMARLYEHSTAEYRPKKQQPNIFHAAPNISSLERRLKKKDISFSYKLFQMIDERGMTYPEVYKAANVTKAVFSKIRTDIKYHPKKTTVLAFAIALKLNIDETEELLRYAGYALTRNDKTDIIVSYFIEKRCYDIIEINCVLLDYDLALLGSS